MAVLRESHHREIAALVHEALGIPVPGHEHSEHRLVPEHSRTSPGYGHRIEFLPLAHRQGHPVLAYGLKRIEIQFFRSKLHPRSLLHGSLPSLISFLSAAGHQSQQGYRAKKHSLEHIPDFFSNCWPEGHLHLGKNNEKSPKLLSLPV